MSDLLQTEDHPHHVLSEANGRRIVAMDSARYVDARNRDNDVVVAASYIGVLPARLIAPHRPRGVIGHDGGIGKDAAGIQGLFYLEALGIPAAAAEGGSAELGNGRDLYDAGIISRMNIFAENCGIERGQSVSEAAQLLIENDPGDITPGATIRRKTVETSQTGRQVVITDSIIHAKPEDRNRNVLVTAGHTGTSGASFLLEFRPWGFICSDGGGGKNNSGTAGLAIVDEHGLAGASVSAESAALGDAFSSYYDGVIVACNEHARMRGVSVGMSAREAASKLLQEFDAK
ncbi:hypothetical protein [Hyphococcus sp.]|uniref:hypothetical protein n=1 Tax=Hyphococcus sp. TaxID=2038636 RepID=UPI003CCC295D